MQTEAVRPYYEYLKKKRFSLVLKRGFDFTAAIFMFVVLLPVFLGISIAQWKLPPKLPSILDVSPSALSLYPPPT